MTTNPFQKATRAQLKARVAFAGPTGAGKTWTALEWATVLAGGGRVAVVDTERGSAALYADHFDFDVMAFDPPYDPGRLTDILKAAEANGYAVVLVDSLSHFWEGEGGTRDIADAAAAARSGGNSFAGWKDATPKLRHLIDTMLGLDAHLVATMRSKMEYVLEEDSRGRKVPRKVGLSPVMRQGVEYEFTLVGDIDLDHRIAITKSRCDRLADELVQPGRADEAAKVFADWLGEGEPLATRAESDALVARINALPEQVRKVCKQAFVDEVGSPQGLRADQLAAAEALVARFEGEGPNPAGPGPAQAGPPPVMSGGEVDDPDGGPATSASPPVFSGSAPPAGPDDGTREGNTGGPPATASPGAVTHEEPTQKGGGDDDPAGKGSPGPTVAAATPGKSSSEAGSEPPPARRGAGEAEASPAPSGVTADQLLELAEGRTPAARKGRVQRAGVAVAQALGLAVPSSFDEVLADQVLAAAVLADLRGDDKPPPSGGGQGPAVGESSVSPPDGTLTGGDPDQEPVPLQKEHRSDWGKENAFCQALAAEHLSGDPETLKSQREALAYQASGGRATSWSDVTRGEFSRIRSWLEFIADGHGRMVESDVAADFGWAVQIIEAA